MGSCISAIYDDYDKYVAFCELVNEKPVSIRDDFYEHEKELMKKHKYTQNGCWYNKLNKN
jgi:hypothetical protein